VPSAAFPTTPTGVLTIVSGNSQTGQFDPRLTMGAFVHFTKPLVVKLTTTAGAPMAGVPVTFACPSGSECKLQGDLIFASGMHQSGDTAITVTTDTKRHGDARCRLRRRGHRYLSVHVLGKNLGDKQAPYVIVKLTNRAHA
jgi:hypothetical protein